MARLAATVAAEATHRSVMMIGMTCDRDEGGVGGILSPSSYGDAEV
jgi:hypothetical protein